MPIMYTNVAKFSFYITFYQHYLCKDTHFTNITTASEWFRNTRIPAFCTLQNTTIILFCILQNTTIALFCIL